MFKNILCLHSMFLNTRGHLLRGCGLARVIK